MGLSQTVTNSPIIRRFSEFRGDVPRQTLFPGISMQHPKQRQSVRLAKPIRLACGYLRKTHPSTQNNLGRDGCSDAGFSQFVWSTDTSVRTIGGGGR